MQITLDFLLRQGIQAVLTQRLFATFPFCFAAGSSPAASWFNPKGFSEGSSILAMPSIGYDLLKKRRVGMDHIEQTSY